MTNAGATAEAAAVVALELPFASADGSGPIVIVPGAVLFTRGGSGVDGGGPSEALTSGDD